MRRRILSGGIGIGMACALIAATAPAGAERAERRVVTCKGQEATIVGTRGDDGRNRPVVGTRRADVIAALAGDDLVRGKGGGDLICAGPGRDFIEGEGGKDRVYGSFGDDLMFGGANDDKLFGNAGDDGLNGQGSRDLCAGGPGDDLAVRSTCERVRSARRV